MESPGYRFLQKPWKGRMSFAEENNQFAVAMYGQLRQRQGNLFFSPFSIRAALAMAQAGARGKTAAQMKEVLRVSVESEPHAAFAETIERLNSSDGMYELVVANSLWCQDGAPLEPGFLDLAARYHGGGVNVVDFRNAAEAAREAINKWVASGTRHKIQGLIPPGSLSAETSVVLANAIYFKGRWVLPFRRTATRDEPFHREVGGTVQVPLMRRQGEIRYVQAEGFQAVDLAYMGIYLSMLVLLPDRKDGLRDLEERLSERMLGDCVTRMKSREVEFFLPRFEVNWGPDNLCAQLATLGMPLAFTRFQADFSGINGQKPPAEESLFFSAVLHKAYVEANEEGTEAAAATAVLVEVTASPGFHIPPRVPIFRADHPFLFAIRDRNSGAILFLGRITDPTLED